MAEIATLVLFVLGAWFWMDTMRAREAALDAGRRACAAENVQFLDWTVAVRKMGLARDEEGRLRIRRTYEFEYSDTGDNRLKGAVTLTGSQLVAVYIQPREAPPAGVIRLH